MEKLKDKMSSMQLLSSAEPQVVYKEKIVEKIVYADEDKGDPTPEDLRKMTSFFGTEFTLNKLADNWDPKEVEAWLKKRLE